MKKTLLLSVVASTMIMAGGDIAPVKPAPVAPAAAVSGWDFNGQAVVYYQTRDNTVANNPDLAGDLNLFDQAASRANAGIQLRAVNKDVAYGIGAGVEVTGLGTLGLQEDVVGGVMQTAGTSNDTGVGGWISQAYLTYGFGNTSLKAGRQELPKALSPFAFSESWNVFKNTFDAALIVNTDLPDTALVGAWVAKANVNGVAADMSNFVSVNPDGDGFSSGNLDGSDNGIFMLTAQNKSIENLALTGTWYYASEFAGTDDANILWGDAKYNTADFNIAIQGGTVMCDAFVNDTVAFGAKIGGNFGMFNASVAYSNVDDGDSGVFNVGGVKTPLYTQMILNQGAIRSDNDTIVARAAAKVLSGTVGLAYDYTTDNSANENDYQELDLTYKTKVFNDSTTLLAAYVYTDEDALPDSQNAIRVWGRYNF